MKKEFEIKEMPIFWRESIQSVPVEGIPSRMDIKLIGPQNWGGVSLNVTKELAETLKQIYLEDENIGYLQDNNPLADIYAPEYIKFIEKHISSGSHISEIGAGGCYSLRKLKQLGYKVSAIDPSPVTLAAGEKYNIQVLSDFFPPENTANLSHIDTFIHYDVLEHVECPESFMQSIYNCLSDSGKTLFVVPDSTLHIQQADASMCIHQHLNYFSEISLQNLVTRAGFKIVEICRSNTTGTIYCCAKKSLNFTDHTFEPEELHRMTVDETNLFFDKVEHKYRATINNIVNLINKNGGQKIGFYPPLRAVPYLAAIIKKFSEYIVFIDDNTKVQSRYICDLEFPIKSRDDALREGVISFLICSKPFREILTRNLSEVNESLEINYLDDLYRLGDTLDS